MCALCWHLISARPSHFHALALNECLKRLPPASSPSDIVHSFHKLADLLGGDEPPIHLGRPGGAPAAIFNPALAILQQRLDHLEQVKVSRSEVDRAAKYLRCAITFYEDEDHRQKAIKELVDEAIGEKGKWGLALGSADNIKPNGSRWYDEFLILVLELKNTLGLSGDALLQAVIDYSKIVSRERVQCPISASLNPVAHLCLQFKRFREYRPRRCHCKSPRNFRRRLRRIDLRDQVTYARPFLRVSCLRRHHPPGPCLRCLVALSGRSLKLLRPVRKLGLSPTLLSISKPDTHRSFQSVAKTYLLAVSDPSWSTHLSYGPREHDHRHVHCHPRRHRPEGYCQVYRAL
jgi:hypothetical protein